LRPSLCARLASILSVACGGDGDGASASASDGASATGTGAPTTAAGTTEVVDSTGASASVGTGDTTSASASASASASTSASTIGTGIADSSGSADSTTGTDGGSSEGGSSTGGIVDGGVVDVTIIAHDDCTFTTMPASISVPEGTEFTVNWISAASSDIEFDVAKIDRFNAVPIILGLEPGTSYHDEVRVWCGELFTGTFDFELRSCFDPFYIPVDCSA
jgi:hypothetical protein